MLYDIQLVWTPYHRLTKNQIMKYLKKKKQRNEETLDIISLEIELLKYIQVSFCFIFIIIPIMTYLQQLLSA